MNRNDLSRIAASMKAELSSQPKADRQLGRVLLRLHRDDRRFTLDIARYDIIPDPTDAATIAAAFGVQCDEPTPVQFKVFDTHGGWVPVKALRYTWIELPC